MYVDHFGDLHDPDYRDFPIPPPPIRATASRSPTSLHAIHAARPSWEITDSFDDDALSDNEDGEHELEDDFDLYDSQSRSSRRSSYQHPPYTYAFTARDYHRPLPFPSYTYSSSPEPSPPTSYESDQNALPDDDASLFSDEKERCSVVKRYRAARSLIGRQEHKEKESERVHKPSAVQEADEEDVDTGVDGDGHDQREDEDEDLEWTPTCAESVRRQWQAISLRFKLGVFRAQRRVRRRVLGT
jgi:hypothetical protein